MFLVLVYFILYFSVVSCKNMNISVQHNETLKSIGAAEGEPLNLGALLLPSDSELEVTKKKSSVPRKEAKFDSHEDTPATAIKNDSTKTVIGLKDNVDKQPPNNKELLSGNAVKSTGSMVNETIHKKPTILSSEALANASRNSQMNTRILNDSLSKSTISDQVVQPSLKIRPMASSRHPDMIMPVVITILVVPMFAILGYMVLRRGQEAWKNRHYKRMDFLLDGMYND